MSGQLDDFRWLVDEDGRQWLRRAQENQGSALAISRQLRKSLPSERARLVVEQVELRRRAATKFENSEQMFFTPVGLEQATDAWIAAHKAARFPQSGPVADLCCGIGGDLLALAARGPVTGVDRDPIATLFARANLQATGSAGMGFGSATVRTADVAECDVRGLDAWHIDPDRRAQGRRSTQPQWHEPGPAVVQRLLSEQPTAAIKLAPAAEVPDSWSVAAELEWISRQRECRQLVVWLGDLARDPGKRRATIVSRHNRLGAVTRSLVGVPSRTPYAQRVGRYVFDPDAAVLAAGLLGVLAAEHGLQALGPTGCYLTGDQPEHDPALACFEALDVIPFDLKRLRRLLRQRGIGRLEIKKRGLNETPESLRRRLGLKGDEEAVLVITPVGGSVHAILARRVVQ